MTTQFIAVRSQDDAPAFFGQETRYGHPVYDGVILNVVMPCRAQRDRRPARTRYPFL